MIDFKGKAAIVTGAGSGIGAATSALLRELGAQVAALDISAPDGVGDLALACDVSDEDQCKTAISETVSRFGGIDIVINNAGVICGMQPPEAADLDDWHRVLSVNLVGMMAMVKHAAPHLKKSKGAVVNTASVAGIRSGAGGNAYSASKAGVINLTQTLACDFGADGVRVNAVCPGLIETGMTQPVFDFARASGKEAKLGGRAELRRYGHPIDVARVIAFLASDAAGFITGQALAVDGGNTASLNMPGMKF